jgi:hypothetical protein
MWQGVGEAKRHHHPFIEPKYGFKSCFPSVGSSHAHLVIAHRQIHLCKILFPFELIKQVFDMRERIVIFYSNLVESLVIGD